jgi:hypothetical protein
MAEFLAGKHDSALRIRFWLSYVDGSEAAVGRSADGSGGGGGGGGGNMLPDAVYAIVMSFDKNPRLQDVEPVGLPMLRRGEKKMVEVTIRPMDPMATTIGATVEFNVSGGVGVQAPMAALELRWRDMLVPAAPQYRHQLQLLFPLLWNHIMSTQGSRLSECMHTVIRVPARTSVDSARVRQALAPFLVADVANDTFQAVMVLLPNNHVLLDGLICDGDCKMHVVTDNLKCLPFLERMLKAILQG